MNFDNTNQNKRELTSEEITAVSGGSDSPNEREEITEWYESRGQEGPNWDYVDRLNEANDQAVEDFGPSAVSLATRNPGAIIASTLWSGVNLVSGGIANFFFRDSSQSGGTPTVTVEEVVNQE